MMVYKHCSIELDKVWITGLCVESEVQALYMNNTKRVMDGIQ